MNGANQNQNYNNDNNIITTIDTSSRNLADSNVQINEHNDQNQTNNNDQNQTNNNNQNQTNNNNQNQNNNNNQNQNNNLQNNPVQPSNNGFQSVEIHMIRISNPNKDEQCRIFHGDPIKTNNSIAIWYALKTTMHYLRKRGELNGTNLITKLDLAAKNNLNSISKYLQECTIDNQVTKDIGELAKAFDEPANGAAINREIDKDTAINHRISDVLDSRPDKTKSIEDLVLDGLTKEKTKIEDPKDLLAKHDFDDLKETIQTGEQARDEKVFLSKAAKKFQDQVKDLEPVKEGNGQDQAIKNYNEAVDKLDEAILEAVESVLGSYQPKIGRGAIDKDAIEKAISQGEIFKSFGLMPQRAQPQGQPQGQPQEKNWLAGQDKSDYYKETAKKIRAKLVNSTKATEKNLFNDLGPDKSEAVSLALSKWQGCLGALSDELQNKVPEDGGKLEGKINNNLEQQNIGKLRNIANDTKIKEITLEFDEYNNFVSHKLFDDTNDINNTMKKFIETVLLGDPKDEECKKAQGDLKGMIEYININSNKDWIHYCSLHKDVDKVKEKDKKYFVPTFIENLFNTEGESDRQNLADNLNTLVEDKTFKIFLSNIMKNDLAVKMINKNVEQLDKAFKDEDSKASRRSKFNEEFWDNNFKGHLPFCGQWKGKVKKNLAMLTGEAAGGIALGKTIAGIFALGTAATWVTIAVTIIAVAVLVSLMIALFKGIGSKMKGEGFYEPSDDSRKSKDGAQIAFLNKIYTAFLTFGADEQQLENLVAEINRKGLDKKSPQGKFFKSMVDMKDFLEKNAKKYKETKDLLGEGTPFQKLKKILEKKEKPPAQDQNNENINITQ